MPTALLCVLLRLAVPVTLGQAEFIATDPCLRAGVHVKLGPNACNYLRHVSPVVAHPRCKVCGPVKATPKSKRNRIVKRHGHR